jgi:hypothetical protein
LDEPVEAPFDFICTGDAGFEQSIHHLAGRDYCVAEVGPFNSTAFQPLFSVDRGFGFSFSFLGCSLTSL